MLVSLGCPGGDSFCAPARARARSGMLAAPSPAASSATSPHKTPLGVQEQKKWSPGTCSHLRVGTRLVSGFPHRLLSLTHYLYQLSHFRRAAENTTHALTAPSGGSWEEPISSPLQLLEALLRLPHQSSAGVGSSPHDTSLTPPRVPSHARMPDHRATALPSRASPPRAGSRGPAQEAGHSSGATVQATSSPALPRFRRGTGTLD